MPRMLPADALARLVFGKPLAELDRAERAELNFLRALLDDNRRERAAPATEDSLDDSKALTLH